MRFQECCCAYGAFKRRATSAKIDGNPSSAMEQPAGFLSVLAFCELQAPCTVLGHVTRVAARFLF